MFLRKFLNLGLIVVIPDWPLEVKSKCTLCMLRGMSDSLGLLFSLLLQNVFNLLHN